MIKFTSFSVKILAIASYYVRFLTQSGKFSLFFLSPHSCAKVSSILSLIFILISLPLMANNNTEVLAEATISQEQALLEKYNIIRSPWLEKNCIQLAQVMEFSKIKQCKIINSPQINAYVLANGNVYFTLGIMQQINNKHQWASILAHENAHLELNHYAKTLEKFQKPGLFFPKSKIKKMLRLHENQADDWSYKRLQEFGLDADQIYFFMQRVIDIRGNKKTNSHIQPSKRTKKNNSAELIDKDLINYISDLNLD